MAYPLDLLNGAVPYKAIPLLAHQHGLLVGVRYSPGPVPASVLAILHAGERDAAVSAGSAEVAAFVAGRIALRAALLDLTRSPETIGALLRTERGAPRLPAGYVASVTHKDGIALALVAVDQGQRVGIDLETLTPDRKHLALRVLRDEELRDVEAAAPTAQWREIITRFSIKEAAYKATDAHLSQRLDFKDISVDLSRDGLQPDGFGVARVALHLSRDTVRLILEATYAAGSNYVIATTQANPCR